MSNICNEQTPKQLYKLETDLEKRKVFPFQSTLDFPASPSCEQGLEVFVVHAQQVLKVYSTIGKLLESPSFYKLLNFFRHGSVFL